MTFSSRPCRARQGQQSQVLDSSACPSQSEERSTALHRMPGPGVSEDGAGVSEDGAGATSRTETQEEETPVLRMQTDQETREELKNQRPRTSLAVQRSRL